MMTIAEMNNLDMIFIFIVNYYLNSMTDKKAYFIAGLDFGPKRPRK